MAQEQERLLDEFLNQHPYEKPSISRLRNPEVFRNYEENLKNVKKPKEVTVAEEKIIKIKQSTLFSDAMNLVLESGLRSKKEILTRY